MLMMRFATETTKGSIMKHQVVKTSKTLDTIDCQGDAVGPRPATKGRATAALMRMRLEAPQEIFAMTTTTPSTEDIVFRAFCSMKGKPMIQEQMQDDSTLQILKELPLAYQIDLVVDRFKKSGLPYPTPDAISGIVNDLIGESAVWHCSEAIFSQPLPRHCRKVEKETPSAETKVDSTKIAAMLKLLTPEEKAGFIDKVADCLVQSTSGPGRVRV